MRGAADGLALSSNALASDAVCRCRDDYGSGAGMGFDGGMGMNKPEDIPQDVWDAAHNVNLNHLWAFIPDDPDDVKLRQDTASIARAIQAAKLEAYQEAAKVAEARSVVDPEEDNVDWMEEYEVGGRVVARDIANQIRKLGEGK